MVKIKYILVLMTALITFSGFAAKGESIAPYLPTLKVKALEHINGTTSVSKTYETFINSEKNTFAAVEHFSFPELDMKINENDLSNFIPPLANDPSFASQFMVGLHKANVTHKVKKIDTLIDKALEIGNYIDKLTGGDLVTMPIIKKQTFGNTDIFIVFQSAKIYPTYAELEVYIKIDMKKKDFNGKDAILYFGAKNIKFSQEKGIIEGSVGLVADYAIKLGDTQDKAGLYLKAMGGPPEAPTGTYVNFDCDGFKEMGVGGAIFFSRDWLIPTDEFGVPRGPIQGRDLSGTPRVNAHFQFVAQDFNDFFINLSIDHFVLAKWDKMSFYLGNANLDLSSYRNPQGIPYPHVQQMGNLWEGVYIEGVAITLPKPFKRANSSFADGGSQGQPPRERIKISAEHLLIDELGVFGNFSIAGQAPLIGGPIMDGEWGWSLDSIGVKLAASDLVGFGFKGGLGVPILSKEGPLAYQGSYDKSLDKYSFSVEQQTNKSFPIWNAAAVNITSVGVTVNVVSDEFRPEISFNGSLTIGNPNDYAGSQSGSTVKMPGLTFQGLTLRTVNPYVSVQSLTINTGGASLAAFPITVQNPTLSTLANGDINLAFGLNLNLMDEGSGVSATGDLAIVGEFKRDLNGAKRLKFKRLDFNGATVTISLPQFYATGQLCLFEEDPVYGKGFSATVNAKVIGEDLANNDGKFNIFMGAIFGSTQGYRYWLVDGFVKSESFSVPIVPGVLELNGFGGGAFHHMAQSDFDEEAAGGNSSGCSGGFSDYAGIVYEPTIATKLGIKFSTSFTGSGGLLSGLLTCIIRFGDGYSLQNISFWGTAELLIESAKGEKILKDITAGLPDVLKSDVERKASNKTDMENGAAAGGVFASVGVSLDFEQGFTFHTFAEVKINLLDALKGSGTLDILADTGNDKWHFYLGGYYDGSVEVPGFFDDTPISLAPVSVGIDYGGFTLSANAYFLTGNDIPGPPPIDPVVAEFFDVSTSANNRGKLTCGGNSPAMGSGIAFGASCFFDFNKFKKGIFGSCFPGYKIDLGGAIGFDLALLKYDASAVCQSGAPIGGFNGLRATGRVYAFINIESGHIVCIPIPHFGIGILLGFDVVKPSYLQGVVVLDFIKKLRFSASFGDECGTPCTEGPID